MYTLSITALFLCTECCLMVHDDTGVPTYVHREGVGRMGQIYYIELKESVGTTGEDVGSTYQILFDPMGRILNKAHHYKVLQFG